MKKVVLLLTITPLIFPAVTLADSEVHVESNVNSSSSNTNQGSSTTDVTINVNGETKTFHSDGNQNIDWTSDDGKSSVKIDNSGDTTTSTSPSPTPTKTTNSELSTAPSPTHTPRPATVDEELKHEAEATQKDILSVLVREIQRVRVIVFNSFKHSLHL